MSEESPEHWAARLRLMPVGPHARLLARPFLRRPTPAAWSDLVAEAIDLRTAGELDLFVVDPLVSFLPGRSESDPGTLLEMLQPLQRLAAAGVAVLLLHHPRKLKADEGSTARGGGALLGFVDIILEVYRFGRLQTDDRRRRLIGLSRHPQTPRNLVYEWDGDGEFSTVVDLHEQRYRDNWEQLRAMLTKRRDGGDASRIVGRLAAGRRSAVGIGVLRLAEPSDGGEVGASCGTGRRADPYRYRLPNEDDVYYDRGELPPLRNMLPPVSDEEVYREAEEVLRRLGPEKPRRWSARKPQRGGTT